MDAACLCDAMAKEIVAQHALNTGRRYVPKPIAALAAAFTRCGDEIMRMREMVEVEAAAPDRSASAFYDEAEKRAGTAICHLCEAVYPLDGSPHLCVRVRKLPMEGKVT